MCLCCFFYDYYHLFDLVFSLIYIQVRYEWRPVEANVWTGRKQTEVGPMKLWHQIAWWHHLLSLEWFHLQTTDFLFFTINNVIPQSQALDRAFARPSATKLEAIPSYSICSIQEVVMALWSIYITSAGDKAGWALSTAAHFKGWFVLSKIKQVFNHTVAFTLPVRGVT